MKRLSPLLVALALACLASGCGPQSGAIASAASTANPLEPVRAQPRLPTVTLFVDQQTLTAEIAAAPMEIMTGMMFRTNLPPNEGMIFVFADVDRRAFWMKNCTVPLSAAYIDPEGVIREIHELEPGNTNSVASDTRHVQFVLEVNQGWFAQHGLKPGALVRTEKGTLRDTFFRFQTPPPGR